MNDLLDAFLDAYEAHQASISKYRGAEHALRLVLQNRVVFGDYLVEPTPAGIVVSKVVCLPRGIVNDVLTN